MTYEGGSASVGVLDWVANKRPSTQASLKCSCLADITGTHSKDCRMVAVKSKATPEGKSGQRRSYKARVETKGCAPFSVALWSRRRRVRPSTGQSLGLVWRGHLRSESRWSRERSWCFFERAVLDEFRNKTIRLFWARRQCENWGAEISCVVGFGPRITPGRCLNLKDFPNRPLCC